MKKIITTIALAFSLGANAQTNLYTEGTDLDNTSPGSNIGTCSAAGTYSISGTLTTPSDGQDWFQFTVANGYQLTNVTYAVTGAGSFNGGWNMNGYNSNSISGATTGTMDITPFTYPQPAGTYFVQMFANFSVGNAWTVVLTVIATPPGNLSFTNGSPQSLTLCQNAAATDILFDITVADDQAGETLQWTVSSAPTHGTVSGLPQSVTSVNGSNNPSGSVTYQPTAGYSGSDAFDVMVSNGTNSATVTINVSVDPTPAPVINSQSGSVNACGDITTTLTVNSTGTYTYTWYWNQIGNPADPASATVDNGTYNETGYTTNSLTVPNLSSEGWGGYFFFCVVTNSVNCSAISQPDTITVNSLPTIAITASSATVCAGTADTLTASGGVTYLWNTSATTMSVSVAPTSNTQYTVTGTDANGCTNMDTLTIMVTNCTTGLNNHANNSQITVYPNPSNGNFVVTTTENTKTIIVTDILGNELVSVTPATTTTNINLSAQPNGVYFIKVMADGKQTVKRIILNN